MEDLWSAFIMRLQPLINKGIEVQACNIEPLPEIEQWRIRHFVKITKLFDSLSVVLSSGDYITACSILRMLYDNWYSFAFIYVFTEDEEKLLRYYLYVYDSICQSVDSLTDLKYDEIYVSELRSMLENKRDYCVKEKHDCENKIRNLPIYGNHKVFIDTIISRSSKKECWTYKSLSNKPGDIYHWSGIYNLLKGKDKCAFINNLSQYVHGLYTTTLEIVPSFEDVQYLLYEAIGLLISIDLYLDENPLIPAESDAK